MILHNCYNLILKYSSLITDFKKKLFEKKSNFNPLYYKLVNLVFVDFEVVHFIVSSTNTIFGTVIKK